MRWVRPDTVEPLCSNSIAQPKMATIVYALAARARNVCRAMLEGAVVAGAPNRRRTVWNRECEILRSVGVMAYRSGPLLERPAARRVTAAFGAIVASNLWPKARPAPGNAAGGGCQAALDGWPLPLCFPPEGNEYAAE